MIKLDLHNIVGGKISLILDKVDFSQITDTYYFSLKQDKDMNDKCVVAEIRKLILNWINCLKIIDNSTYKYLYLPFDFSDEYIGFLRLQKVINNKIIIDYGYSEDIVGYEVSIINHKCFKNTDISSFVSLTEAFECSLDQFIKELIDIEQYLLNYN